MPESVVTNPAAAFARPADYTTYLDANGNLIEYGGTDRYYRCSAAVAKWSAVALVAATASTPLSIEELDVSDAFAAIAFVGVAQEAGAAGDIIRVREDGVTLVKVDTGDPVFGDVAIKGASDGTLTTAGTAGGTWDGSDVAGTGLGMFLDVENAADLAPIKLFRL